MTTEYEQPDVLLECECGSVVWSRLLRYAVIWDRDDIGHFESLGEALSAFAEASDAYEGQAFCRIPREDLWLTLQSEAVDEFLPRSPDGWVHRMGHWVPADFLPEFDGPSSRFAAVHQFGELGVRAAVYEWEGLFLLQWSGPEGEGQDWEFLGKVSEKEAIGRASDLASDLLADWNLEYDELMGLDNLAVVDRFAVPDDAEPILELGSCLSGDGSPAAELMGYYWPDGDGPAYLIGDPDTGVVVGRYENVDDIEDAVVVEDGFEFSIERLSWADEPDDEEA